MTTHTAGPFHRRIASTRSVRCAPIANGVCPPLRDEAVKGFARVGPKQRIADPISARRHQARRLAKGVPSLSIDQWYTRELNTTVEKIRAYEKETYYAGEWRNSYEPWVQMLVGMYRGPGTAETRGFRQRRCLASSPSARTKNRREYRSMLRRPPGASRRHGGRRAALGSRLLAAVVRRKLGLDGLPSRFTTSLEDGLGLGNNLATTRASSH